jgi:F-type H+-transporting ATPase subunit a
VTTTQPRRIGFKRWVVIGLIVLGGYLAFGARSIFTPVSPAVVLAPEPFWPGVYLLPAIPPLLPEPTPFTNTFLAILVTDVVLFLIALGAYRFARSGQTVPRGFYNFFEFLVEFLWNLTESTAGRWARRMFPIVATIFLLVFTANMIKLLPGFESIGYMKEAHGAVKGYEPVQIAPGFYTIDGSKPAPHTEGEAAPSVGEGEAAAEGSEGGEHAAAEGAAPCHSCEVVPSLRATATDLNFTFALAVVAVVMTQVFGMQALGLRYFQKFINVSTMISKPLFGVIDFGVGLLELISEVAKILSFGFRLFGNIFAGALLLAILGSLTAIIVPSALYGLEFFVGIIQAYVFAMLTLTFMSQATVSHHGDEHHEEHGKPAAEGAH